LTHKPGPALGVSRGKDQPRSPDIYSRLRYCRRFEGKGPVVNWSVWMSAMIFPCLSRRTPPQCRLSPDEVRSGSRQVFSLGSACMPKVSDPTSDEAKKKAKEAQPTRNPEPGLSVCHRQFWFLLGNLTRDGHANVSRLQSGVVA